MASIRSTKSLDEEAGLGCDGFGGGASVVVEDIVSDEKIHIHMHTIFEMKDCTASEVHKNTMDSMDVNRSKRRESRWGWDRDEESGGEVTPCRWRRYSIR